MEEQDWRYFISFLIVIGGLDIIHRGT